MIKKKQPKVGIVLSSGSMKAMAALALYDFLKEENINVDLQVGCSGGSIFAALNACGFETDQILKFGNEFSVLKPFSQIDFKTLFSIANVPFCNYEISKGLLKESVAMKSCKEIFGDRRLEDLQPETIMQATDIQTGEGVVLSKGLVSEAVYASSAFFPIMPPINFDKRWLVDGAYTSPMPVMEAVHRDADVIIAMLFSEKLNAAPQNFLDAFFNVKKSFSLSLVKSQNAMSINMHNHEIIIINVRFDDNVPLTDSAYFPELLEAGRRAVELKKTEILEAIDHYHIVNRKESSG